MASSATTAPDEQFWFLLDAETRGVVIFDTEGIWDVPAGNYVPASSLAHLVTEESLIAIAKLQTQIKDFEDETDWIDATHEEILYYDHVVDKMVEKLAELKAEYEDMMYDLKVHLFGPVPVPVPDASEVPTVAVPATGGASASTTV